MKTVAVVLSVLIAAYAVYAVNNRPIIGILNQKYDDKHTYIAASYVKWIESAGGRVVPLFFDKWSVDEMASMLKNLNGVLLPGGSNSLSGKYYSQLQTIFNFVKHSNDNGVHFPLWGTCLGVCSLLLYTLT